MISLNMDSIIWKGWRPKIHNDDLTLVQLFDGNAECTLEHPRFFSHTLLSLTQFPAPKYFWKVVHNREANQAIAFVGVNDAHLSKHFHRKETIFTENWSLQPSNQARSAPMFATSSLGLIGQWTTLIRASCIVVRLLISRKRWIMSPTCVWTESGPICWLTNNPNFKNEIDICLKTSAEFGVVVSSLKYIIGK